MFCLASYLKSDKMKKKSNTNIEAKRKGFFFTGIVIALGISLVAFEWKQGEFLPEEMELYSERENSLPDEDQPIRIRPINKPTPVMDKKGDDIKVVDTLVIIDLPIIDTNQVVIADFDPTLPIDTITDDTWDPIPDVPKGPVRIVDRKPEYPGGQKALIDFLNENTEYPEMAFESGKQDIVYVEFVVELDGTPSRFTIKKGKHKSLNNEAIRVAKQMQNWKPGELNGKKVATYFKIPFVFTIK